MLMLSESTRCMSSILPTCFLGLTWVKEPVRFELSSKNPTQLFLNTYPKLNRLPASEAIVRALISPTQELHELSI